MKNEKVYIEGYVVGSFADTLGNRGKQIQLINGDIVDIDDNFIYKSIEPEKVKVPKFVADWYKENKDSFEANLYRFVCNLTLIFNGAEINEFVRWFLTAGKKPFQTLVNMHQFGYEVEEEPKYTVRVKGICGNHETLNREKHSNKWLFSDLEENSLYGTHHTRKELEDANFGWVFDCPGVEVEEVEE